MAFPLTVTEIETQIAALAANADYRAFLTVTDLPFQTKNGSAPDRHVKLLQIGNGDIPVLIIGGVHAREWAPPDALLAFAQKLLEAKRLNSSFTDSAFSWAASPADQFDPDTSPLTFPPATIMDAPAVARIMARLKLFIIPCSNPTGRDYSITNRADREKKQWRKNRKDVGAACGEIGVDINRNFDAGWDFQRYYDVASAVRTAVTDNACFSLPALPASNRRRERIKRDSYHGTLASSEEETKNIKFVIDTHRIRFFLDVHSAKREIYYPTGLNPAQTGASDQTYLNPSFDRNMVTNVGGRPINTPAYGEYFPPALLGEHISISNLIQSEILVNANGGINAANRIALRSNYQVKQSFTLYASPGASDDYVFGTQFSLTGGRATPNALSPVYAFAIEIGTEEEGGFQPTNNDIYRKYQREIWSAVSALTKHAANWAPIAAAAPRPSRGCLPILLLMIGGSVIGMLLLFFYFLT